jgi:hypothetical protein
VTKDAVRLTVFTEVDQNLFCAFVTRRHQSLLLALADYTALMLSAYVANARMSAIITTATIKRAEKVNTPAEDSNKQENGPRFRKPNQTRAARRRRELIAGLTADLGRSPNTMETALIVQAADLIIARDLATAAANTTAMLKISGQITRTLSTLRGRGSKPQSSGPTLAEHLASRAARATERRSDEAA